jgi:trehalose 6-phosphate phosphatase
VLDQPVAGPDELRRILAPLRERPNASALLLDLDGTLADIRPRPEDVEMIPGARAALARLRDRLALVGFVSGRRLADLEAIVGLPGLAYAGNHGMELRRPGEPPEVAPAAAPHVAAISAFAARWPPAALDPHGVWLEDKGVTLSFHSRTADVPEEAERFLAAEVVPAARVAGLVTTSGRRLVEVRPPVRLDKGTAVRDLLDGTQVRLAAFMGDDRTDADAWRALHAMRDEGRLDQAVAVAVAGAEVPPEVRAEADVEVAGPAGALEVLRLLG